MRIAWIIYNFEEYSAHHVNALCVDHEVLLVVPRDDVDRFKFDPRVELYAFHKPRMRQPVRQFFSIRKLLERVDAFQPDVVHFQQGHMWFNFALPKLKRRYPLVLTIHDPRYHEGDRLSQKTPQWVMDYGFRQSDHIIVHGRALAEEVQRLFDFSADRVHVIPHVAMGIQESIDSSTLPTPASPADVRRVLFFGRIWDYKGLDTLIAAEPLIASEMSDVRIVIAGRGDDFTKYANQMKNPQHFEVHNRWITNQERACFFEAADLVVLPYNEATQSGVVPVAYRHRRPVVATDVGALSDCVLDNETGLLVPPRDPAALAKAIVDLLKDDAKRVAMGSAGHRYLTQFMSPETVAAATASVYQLACQDASTKNTP